MIRKHLFENVFPDTPNQHRTRRAAPIPGISYLNLNTRGATKDYFSGHFFRNLRLLFFALLLLFVT